MRCFRISHRLLALFCCAALLLISAATVHGQDLSQQDLESKDDSALQSGEKLLTYKGAGSFYLGFRLVDVDTLSRVAEYEDDDSSLTFGIDGIAVPLPHRYHTHVEYTSGNSYYGDLGYAYKDFLLFRDLFVGVHHNLDHYHYLYPNASPALTYEDRSGGDDNYMDFYKNDLLLRVKAPDFPFHAFFKSRYITREGGIEERFLTGGIGNLIKTSETRKIDWESQDITLGMNSHLGPVEVEYAHEQAEFDPGPNNVLYDYYPDSRVFGRPGDTYSHNVIPETESVANSLKFHSSYTGQIVASATLSNAKHTNNYSDTETEAWKAAFDLRWIPDPRISFFLKYRHSELDKDNPDEVIVNGLVHSNTHPVRSLISSRTDLFSLSARYRPLSMVTLIGKYELELRERNDVDEWEVLPENSDIHRVKLTAHARPLRKLKLKAVYDYNVYDNPSYNTEPDHMNKVRLNATYTPASWVTALLDYSLIVNQRDDLRYRNTNPQIVLEEGERDGRRDHFLGSLAFVLSPDATLTASWNYNRWKVEQDLAHAMWNNSGLPYYDRAVAYEDESNTWALSLYYQLRKDLSLTADLAYIMAQGEYLSGVPLQDGSTSLGSFSEMDNEETTITVQLDKKILQDWEIGLKFQAGNFNDELSGSGPDHQDGDLYITTLILKRSF